MTPPSTAADLHLRGRGRFALGLTAVELILGLSQLRLHAPAVLPGGDPQGGVANALAVVSTAVPSDARVVSRYDAAAVWSSCGARPASAGWQDPLVAITFRSAIDARSLVGHADAALTSQGWAPVPDLRDAVWSKVIRGLAGRGTARLSLNDADRTWTITATAPVPGPHRPAAC